MRAFRCRFTTGDDKPMRATIPPSPQLGVNGPTPKYVAAELKPTRHRRLTNRSASAGRAELDRHQKSMSRLAAETVRMTFASESQTLLLTVISQ